MGSNSELLKEASAVFRIRSRVQKRIHWKATFRSAPVLGYILLGKWREEVRIFRWRWLAKAAAARHRLRSKDVLTDTIVEPYVPGANVLSLNARNLDQSLDGP